MDPIERAVSERLGGLRDEGRWYGASVMLHADAGALRPSRRRWWAWAVPAVVIVAAVAALAAFSLGGVLSLGRASQPAAPTDVAATGSLCMAQQLHAVIGHFPDDAVTEGTQYRAGDAQLVPLAIAIANVGSACAFPSVPQVVHTSDQQAPYRLEGSKLQHPVAIELPADGVIFAGLIAPETPRCPLFATGAARQDGTLSFTLAADAAPLNLELGQLSGCPLDGALSLFPFHSSMLAADADLHGAGWVIGASPSAPADSATALQTALADRARQQASLAELPVCALANFDATTSSQFNGLPRKFEITLHNTRGSTCTLKGSPTLSFAYSAKDIGPRSLLADPFDSDLVSVARGADLVLAVTTSTPRGGTAPESCRSSAGMPSGGYSVTMPDRPGRVFVPAQSNAQCASDRGVGLSVGPFLPPAQLGGNTATTPPPSPAPLLGDAVTTATPPVALPRDGSDPAWAPCTADELSAKLYGGYGTAGEMYWDVGVRNSGDHACMLRGTPALHFADASGDLVPPPLKAGAVSAGPDLATPYVELRPGTIAYARMSVPEAGFVEPPAQCKAMEVASVAVALPDGGGTVLAPVPDKRMQRCADQANRIVSWPFSAMKSTGPWGDVPNGFGLCGEDQLHIAVTGAALTKSADDAAVNIEIENTGTTCALAGPPAVAWVGQGGSRTFGEFSVQQASAKQAGFKLSEGMAVQVTVWVHLGAAGSGHYKAGTTIDGCTAQTPYGLGLQLSSADDTTDLLSVPLSELPACAQGVQQLEVAGPFVQVVHGQ